MCYLEGCRHDGEVVCSAKDEVNPGRQNATPIVTTVYYFLCFFFCLFGVVSFILSLFLALVVVGVGVVVAPGINSKASEVS